MDVLAENSDLSLWLIQYGSFALFVLLTLGIIILPVPEETLMVIAGILMKQGKLPVSQTVSAAYLGCLCGITASYVLGRTGGLFMITRYGSWLGIGPKQLEYAHRWFKKFGKWALCMGYFIPGVRHFTGLCAGMTSLQFKSFALFAYTGAFVWVSLFLSIGYFFGHYALSLFENIEINFESALLVLAAMTIIYFIFIRRKL